MFNQLKYFYSLLLTTIISLASVGQDSVRYRVLLIGDAGEMTGEQKKSLNHAANHIIPGKTTVIYLGDNIYPRGIGLPGSKNELETQDIIRSQYMPMRSKGAPVYFIPGNHDWDRMGPKGLEKIKRQWQFLEEQGDSLLKLVPANGCPDPYEINLGDSLTIIIFDSEWWLWPFDKTNTDGDCDCQTKADVLARLDELRYKNRNKVVLLTSHHPFQSYGVHGGKYSWKDHIFPLTSVNKNLYIPLPIIGSLYPMLRSTFTNPEDIKHPLYQNMIDGVDALFDNSSNVIHIAGHDHGLQFIKSNHIQVVSGSGAKRSHTKKGKYSLFADANQGYVTADLLTGNAMRFTYYVYSNDTVKAGFSYTVPYVLPKHEINISDRTVYEDSIIVQVHPSYNTPGKFHRKLFGENYRKEWAAPTKLPVIRLSKIQGGLTPLKLGGGMQSKSLRLADKDGKEWVIRSVEKSPDALLPAGLKQSFARDWLDDATSAQHPFSALIVPPIANAVNVPHAVPIIGVAAPDSNLGVYGRTFNNMVVLLEQREPLGKSDNSIKMKANLQKDNDNKLNRKEVLQARMLDMLIGDWDRHEDQWRWYNESNGKDKKYLAVPRDRDQVFHLTQGLIPSIASRSYVLPTLQHFGAGIENVKWLQFKTRFLNAYPSMQFSFEDWMQQATLFKTSVTDSVLEEALLRLPASAYDLRHQELLNKLKVRRDGVPAAMETYYRFINKIVDIQTTDKSEFVQINDAPDGGLAVSIHKINKRGQLEDLLMNKVYDPAITKELRIYVRDGNDSIVLNNKNSAIKVRLIGGKDAKTYHVLAANLKVPLYDKDNGSRFYGDTIRFKKHISNDSLNTAFVPVNLYNILMPLINIGINRDDGLLIGAGFKYTRQEGFRKLPYTSMQQLMVSHSFSTKAYRIKYKSEWIEALGKADFTIAATAKAPDNTINFFGRGNATPFSKSGDYVRYYRTRFSLYELDPAIRWRNDKGSSLSIGPSLNYYVFDKDDNNGRFITNISQIGSYDSSTIDKDKWHLGLNVHYLSDTRNSKIIPQWGSYINMQLLGYKGLGKYAESFAQFIPEIALYRSIDKRSNIVVANRIGGVVSIGKTAFYQSAFIGGQENLLGYRQYRFAGKHSIYNNLELRIKLADVASYIVPGQFGITGFWDTGRVWESSEDVDKWHHGTGGGVYFAPASLVSFNFVMGYSKEGWYPYFSMGMRF